jgi:cellulose synthase/poly-beta-1,6-N-acetylglucosamine synthase-like glycosyltransferase
MQFEIGICAYNEDKNLNRLLNFLIKEQFSNELENIFVVCSGCTDNSEKVVKKYSKLNGKIVLIHEETRMGKPHAINEILRLMKTPVLIFLAADNIPRKKSVDRLLFYFKTPIIGGVNGHPIPLNGFKLNTLIWQLYYDIYIQNKSKRGKIEYLTGEFCAFRPIFNSIPDKIINDDAWIGMKLIEMGFRIEYCENAISEFNSPVNILEYIIQRVRVIKGNQQIKAKNLINNLYYEPTFAIKSLVHALLKFNWLNLLAALFLELYCIIKSKFYKKGVIWDKIKTG